MASAAACCISWIPTARTGTPISSRSAASGAGDRLRAVDHISQSMPYDEMLSWLLFYTGILDLQRLPQMEIADPRGLVQSQAIINTDQSLRFVLNGSIGRRARCPARFISEFFGSGVQHIAFSCEDIFATVADMRARGADFLEIPDNYYDDIEAKYDLDAATMTALRDQPDPVRPRGRRRVLPGLHPHFRRAVLLRDRASGATIRVLAPPTRRSGWRPRRARCGRSRFLATEPAEPIRLDCCCDRPTCCKAAISWRFR